MLFSFANSISSAFFIDFRDGFLTAFFSSTGASSLAAAANKLQQVLAEPQEEDDYELFDFEKDENDPDYRTVTVSYDGNSFVLHGKQLLKIFNSTNFTDFGSLRYLYKYIEKSGAIDQMKEMGIEDGDIIKIEDFEFEYYDEDYFED